MKDKGYEILCISQFTLYHVLKGNKLDFHNAMAAEKSETFYKEFLDLMRAQYQADLIKGQCAVTTIDPLHKLYLWPQNSKLFVGLYSMEQDSFQILTPLLQFS